MEHLFLGGHPAVDFLNTALAPDGVAIERIPDGRAYVEWLVEAGLLDEERAGRLTRRFGVEALDAAAADARRTREWAREWLDRWRSRPGSDYRDEVAALNKLLARDSSARAVVATKDGFKYTETPNLATAAALLALVAQELAAFVTREDPSLLKSCAGDGCTLWFLDRTRAHGRMFCSAAACGNRAKVAAFRQRQRS